MQFLFISYRLPLSAASKAGGRQGPFFSCFGSQELSKDAIMYTTNGTRRVVECKIEIMYVNLGASYYGM